MASISELMQLGAVALEAAYCVQFLEIWDMSIIHMTLQ